MKLKRVRVQNYRSIKDITVELDSHTVIVGGNGAGKSTILRAIEKFYASSGSVELDDFCDNDDTQPIDIELTFCNLSEPEQRIFGSRTLGGELTVARVFQSGARNNGRYFGSTLKHAAFDEIRLAEGANPKRQAYDRIRASAAQYATLLPVARADQISEALQAWELAHPNELVLGRDDGQFFGFTNVARGSLQRCTSFVFIPAVREAAGDAQDAKGSVIAQLMELVVRSAVLRKREVREWRERVSQEYRELTSPDQLPELAQLANDLTGTLSTFYREAAVNLSWQGAQEINVPLPNAAVALDDDGFAGPVDRKGHGLQRAFILTLLQHLAKATAAATSEDDQEIYEARAEGEGLDYMDPIAVELEGHAPGLVLAIEEPELYQHPTKQRHFANVLRRLSAGALPGAANTSQVIFASHSPLFVSVERFDELRIARRALDPEEARRRCDITQSTLEAVCRRLELAHERPVGSFTAETLRPRLHILSAELAEAFFAECVVLVEGGSDRAALLATAKFLGLDFEAEGIAVLGADGKTKLDRPAAIFLESKIPTYVVWDCDSKVEAYNKALRLLCQPTVPSDRDPLTHVAATWACFEHKLETTLKAEIGEDVYNRILLELCTEYSLDAQADAQKSPGVMRELLSRSAAEGRRSATLEGIVQAVMALRDNL